MTRRFSRLHYGGLLVAVWVGLLLPMRARAAAVDLHLSPASISIGSFFQGTELQITAVIPPRAAAVIEVRGPKRVEHLARKGRRWGLWMNTGELVISEVPNLYFFTTSEPSLATAADASWGYQALKRGARVQGAVQPEGDAFFLDQFIALKESEGMYVAKPDKITVAPGPEGCQTVTARFHLPARVRPGGYQVALRVVQDGRTLEEKQQGLPITKVGLPSLVSTLAHEQAVLYGIVAVLIAIITGFLMGFFFKGKGSH